MKLFRNNEGKINMYRIKNENSTEVGIQNLLMQFEEKCL